MKKNDIVEAEIDGYNSEGLGVCRVAGRAVFVPRTLRGERWRVRIVKVTASAVYGRAEEPLLLSNERREPACPRFGLCGGCDLMHMSYAEELRLKLDKLNAALKRIGRQEYTAGEIIGADALSRYRNKAVFNVSNVSGKPAFGFYRERSHELVAVEDCLIQTQLSCRAAAALTAFMEKHALPAYDESTGAGLVRHIFCRQAHRGPGAVACVVSNGDLGRWTGPLVDYLLEACPELTGVVLNVNRTRGNTVLAGDFYTLWGEANITDALLDLEFEIAPQSFFQVNPPQAEKLYSKALEYAAGDGRGLALDLYCGAGTISLCLARDFGRVIGAEIVPQAIENAGKNARRNGVENVGFICADAGQAAARLAAQGLSPQAIVVDPPRKGMDEAAIAAVAAMAPERIVYVSCDPATLARDILRFNALGYTLSQSTAVDMFPRTAHVETVVLMSRKDA